MHEYTKLHNEHVQYYTSSSNKEYSNIKKSQAHSYWEVYELEWYSELEIDYYLVILSDLFQQ